MSKYVVVTFKGENRNTVTRYLEEYFKTNETVFVHRFEANSSVETFVFETNPSIVFPDKIKEFTAQNICSYFIIGPHDKSVILGGTTMSRMLKPLPDDLFQTLESLIMAPSRSLPHHLFG